MLLLPLFIILESIVGGSDIATIGIGVGGGGSDSSSGGGSRSGRITSSAAAAEPVEI
jgi:hypothetical protein